MRLSLLASPVAHLCVVVLSCCAPLVAQTAPDPYASESIVIVRSENVYSFAADGTGWRERTIVARVQSDAAVRQLGVLSIPFAGSSERVEIAYARVRRADGTVVETPVGDAMEMPEQVTREAPFYSDLKQKQLPIRNLRVGDTFEWKARIVKTKAEAPGEFWGQESMVEDAVTLEQVIELRVPSGKAVKVWSPALKPAETTVAVEHVYRWTGSQLKPTAGKEADAAAEARKKAVWTPEQELNEEQGKLPGIAWTTFPSWEAVGAWYRGLEGDRMQPGPEVKAKVAEVTAGKTTEEEKVRAVYGYVATQVRYIGVAFGVGRYQPHRAAEVLENQYGDCKDKHTLLAAMLDVLGLKANAVLIGAGVRFNPEVPSPAAFNHLITQVPVGGKTVWLDATAEVAPYRMLVSVIRDRDALVIPETGLARVEKTPKELPFKQLQTLDAVGSLDKDGVSNSKMTLTLRGDGELFVRTILRQIPPAQYEQLVQKLSETMGFGGTVSHAEISRADDTAEPLTIHYDYHREKVGDWDNLRTLAQLSPVSLPVPDEKNPPVRSISLTGPRVETSTSTMKLPEGWSAQLPEAVHAHSKYVNWDQTYRLENGTLYAERKVEVLVEKVPQAEWKDYKKWTEKTTPGDELYVQLTRPECAACGKMGAQGAAKGKKEVVVVGPSNPDAAALVKSAYEAVQQHDLMGAAKLLDQASALNDTQARLWSTYGFAAFQRGNMTIAIQDYEKELEYHPDAYGVYGSMASAYMRLKDRKHAIEVLRRWVAANPVNPAASTMLAQALMDNGDAAAAVTAVEAGIAGLPRDRQKDERLQFTLGKAQMRAGMKDKGAETLVGLLKQTEDPMLLNDAAYSLADEGQQLPLAESSTRTALEKLYAESRDWTLDEALATLRSKSQLILAAWDTMGWVLHREGKDADAEPYVKAAWLNAQHTEVGEHLGDILAARGDKAGAVKTYGLALATISPLPTRDKPSENEQRLKKKLQALGGKDSDTVRSANRLELKALRTSSLAVPGAHDGYADYKLLMGSAGVAKVQPKATQELTGGADALKKAKFPDRVPAGVDGRVMLLGTLTCHAEECEVLLQP